MRADFRLLGLISVLIVIALLPAFAKAAQPVARFSENFAAGLGNWKQATPYGYTIEVDKTTRGVGATCVKVTDIGLKEGGTISREISMKSGYLRFYVNLGTGFFAQQPADWSGISLMSVTTSNDKRCFALAGMKNGGHNKFYMDTAPGGRPAWDYELSLVDLKENTWYCLEFYIPERIGTAGVRWWLDGVEQWPLGTNFSSYTQPWGKLTLGLPEGSGFSGSVYYADIVLSDDYNGPIGYKTALPAAPAAVRDGLALDIDAGDGLKQLSANWDAVGDPVTKYWYAIGTTAGGTEVSPWTDNGFSLQVTRTGLNLSKGTRYFVSVKAENKAGMGPVATSNGIVADGSRIAYPAITPNPIISRGKKVYASVDPASASKLTDGLYDPLNFWNAGSSPSWVAINVGTGYSRLMLIWDSIADESLVATCSYIVANPISPADYTIQTSANSTNGADGTWTTVATVTGNFLHCREHAFDFTGKSWVRFNVSKPLGTNGVQLDEIDLYDISKGASDTWMFFGDSITQRAFRRRNVCEQPSFAEVIHKRHPAYFPAMVNGGIGGDDTEDALGTKTPAQHAGNIDLYLKQFPDIRFWCIGFGTNDAGAKQYDPAYYKKNMQTLIDKIKAAGRVPIIAQIPWNLGVDDPTCPYKNIPSRFNPAIKELVASNNLLPGPNLYAFFKNSRWHLFSDHIHPSFAGSVGMNAAWADMVDGCYQGGVETAKMPPRPAP